MSNQEIIDSLAKDYAKFVRPLNKQKQAQVKAFCTGFAKLLEKRFELITKEEVKREIETAQWTNNVGGLRILKHIFPKLFR